MTAALSPREWDASFSAPPDLCSSDGTGWSGALLRRWHDTDSLMEQPPLNHHYLVLHLGGPKRIERSAAGTITKVHAEADSLSLVSAGTNYNWVTDGPINFAHLYLHPNLVGRAVSEVFDRDPRSAVLVDFVGQRLPLLSALLGEMLRQVENPAFGARLMLDTLLHSLTIALLSQCSTLGASHGVAPHAIAPRRLRRVQDFIEANLAADIELDDLASVAGCSRYHFSRAFRDATGLPPYRYVIHRRIDAAKSLLLLEELPVAEIASRCGFNSHSQFAAMFRRFLGTTPGRFRREH